MDDTDVREFDLEMRVFCVLSENPGMSYAEARKIARQEEREEKTCLQKKSNRENC